MALISEKYGCLFLMAPRTGCTSLGLGVLIPYLAAEWLPPEPIVDANGKQIVDSKHSTLEQLMVHRLIEPERAARLFKFTTVRNPFDSLVSLYTNMRDKYRVMLDDPNSWVHRNPAFVAAIRKANSMTFPEWMRDRFNTEISWRHPWSRVVRRLPGPRHLYGEYIRGADFVMRFENLEEDFRTVLDRLQLPRELPIPHLNRSKARERDYRGYYDDETRRTVSYVFRKDLTRFGYTF